MSELFGNEQAVETTGKVADKFGNLSDKLEQVKTVSGALEILYNKKINKTFENFTKVMGNGEETLGKLVKQQNSAVKTLNKLNTATGEFNKEVAKSETVFAKLFKTLNPVVKTLEKLAIVGLGVKGISALSDGLIKVVKELNNAGAALSILEKSGFDLSEIYGLQQFNDDIVNLNTGGIEDFATTAVSKFTQISSLLAQIGTLIPEQLAQGLKKGEDVLGDYFDKYQELVGTTLKNTVTSTDALKASYTALQAGFSGASVDNVVNSSLKLLVAQGGDAEQIVALLKQTMTAFGLEANKSGDILGKLNKVVDLGITTIPELQYGFGALGVAADTAGVSFDEMAGSLVQLTKAGSTTSTAMTKLSNLYNQITSGQITERLKSIAATYIENGKAVAATFDSQTIATKGFAKAAEDVYASLGKSNEKLRAILPDSEAFAGFTGVLTEGADGLEAIIKQITNSGVKELEKAFKIRIDNDKVVQFSQVVNRASESVLKLGKVLAPVFDKGLDYVDAMVDKLSYLVENYGSLIKVVVGFSVAVNGVTAAAKALLGTVVVLAGAFLQWQLLTGKLWGNFVDLVRALGNGGSATNKYNLLWTENVSVTKKVLGTIGQLLGVYDLQKSKVESLTEAERTKIREVAGGTSKLISNAKEEIATRDTQIQKLEDQILAHRKRVAEIEKEIQANNRLTESEQQSIKQRKDLLKEAIASAKAEIKLREEKIQQIEKEIAANKDLTESQKTAANQNKETLQQRVADKKKELAKLEDEDNKLVTKQPLTDKEKQQKENLIAQINTEADNKVATLRNVKSNNLSAKDKLKELTERLKTEDPMNLLEDVLARDVKLSTPQSFKTSGKGFDKLSDIKLRAGRVADNVGGKIGQVGEKLGDVGKNVAGKLDGFGVVGQSINKIGSATLGASKGLGNLLSIGLKVGGGLLKAFLSPVAILTTLGAIVGKLAIAYLDADREAEKYAKQINGDADTVSTMVEKYQELGKNLVDRLPGAFKTAAKAAGGFLTELGKIKDEIGAILNGSARLYDQLKPEWDRFQKELDTTLNIEVKATKRLNKELESGKFRDVFIGDKNDQRANLNESLSSIDRTNVTREESTKFADVVDKTRASLLKEKNASAELTEGLQKSLEGVIATLVKFGATEDEIEALKVQSKLSYTQDVNKDLIKRFEDSGRDASKFNEKELEITGEYTTLLTTNKDNKDVLSEFDKKRKKNKRLDSNAQSFVNADAKVQESAKQTERLKKNVEDTFGIIDSINIYLKNLSDSEGTTNPYLSSLKRSISDTIIQVEEDAEKYEKVYDKYIQITKQGNDAAKQLTKEELEIVKNRESRLTKAAETVANKVNEAVENKTINAGQGANLIKAFLAKTKGIDTNVRQQLIQQERALLNAQYENNVDYLEKLRTLYQQYGEKELVYNEGKFRKLQQLELQQLDEKIKQANLNYGAVKDDKEISKEEKNKRKVEVDILVDQKQLRQLEQAIELLQKQNDIQQKRLSLNKQILETSRNDELYITQKLNDDIRKIEEDQAQLKIKEAENYYAIVSKNEKASKEEIITAQKEIALVKEEFNKTVFDNEVKRREESLRLYEASNKTVINKLFLQYAKGNAAVYDELFFKQEELRSKTLEAEIANLNKIREYIVKRGEDTTLVDEKITDKQKELVSEYFAFAQRLLQRYQDNVNNGVEKYNIALNNSASNLNINKELLQGQLDVLQQQVDLVEKVGDAREADLNYAKENTALKSKQQKLEKQIIKEQREALTQKLEAEKQSLLLKQAIRDIELDILKIQQQQNEAEKEAAYKSAVAQNALAQKDPNLSPEEKQAEQLKEDKAKGEYEASLKQGQLLQVRGRLNDNQTAIENYGLALSARQQEDAIREREVANTSYNSDNVRYAKERETRQQIQAPVLQGVGDININQTAVDTKITKAQQEASKNAKVIVAGYESSVNKLKDPIVKQQEQSNEWLKKIYTAITGDKINTKETTGNTSSTSNQQGESNNKSQQQNTVGDNTTQQVTTTPTNNIVEQEEVVIKNVKQQQTKKSNNTIYVGQGYISPNVRGQLGVGEEGNDGRKTDPKTGLALDPAFGWTEEYMPLKKKQGDLNRETDRLWAQYHDKGTKTYEQVQKMAEKNVGWTEKDSYDNKWRLYDNEEKNLKNKPNAIAERELLRLRRQDAEARQKAGYTMFDTKGYEVDPELQARMNVMRNIVEGSGLILEPEQRIIEQERKKGGKNNPYLIKPAATNIPGNKQAKQVAQIDSNYQKKQQQVATNNMSLFQPKEDTVAKPVRSIVVDDKKQTITANNVKVYGQPQPKQKDTITLPNLNKDVDLQEARKLAQQNAPSEVFIKRLQGSAYNINKQIDDIDDKLQQPGLSKPERDKLRKDKIGLKKDRDGVVSNRDKQKPAAKPKAQPPVAKAPVVKKPTPPAKPLTRDERTKRAAANRAEQAKRKAEADRLKKEKQAKDYATRQAKQAQYALEQRRKDNEKLAKQQQRDKDKRDKAAKSAATRQVKQSQSIIEQRRKQQPKVKQSRQVTQAQRVIEERRKPKKSFFSRVVDFFTGKNANSAKNGQVTTGSKTPAKKQTSSANRAKNNVATKPKQPVVKRQPSKAEQAVKQRVNNIRQTANPNAKSNQQPKRVVQPQQRKVTQPQRKQTQPLPTNNFAKQRKIIEDRLAQQQKDKIAAQNKREQERLKKLTPSERKLEETIKQVNPSFKQSGTGVYSAPQGQQTQLQALVPNVEKQQQKLTGIAKLRQERLARVEKRNNDLNKPTTPQVADKSESNNSNVVNSNNVAFSPQITINVNSEGKEIAKDVKEQLNDALFTLFNEVQRRQQA